MLLLHKEEPRIKVDRKGVTDIILVNNNAGTAKEIDKWMDLDAICELFNSTEMHVTNNHGKDHNLQAGGASYSFIIHYMNHEINIAYCQGIYLINNGMYYRINNTKFEDFWKLDYEEKKFRYFYFVE